MMSEKELTKYIKYLKLKNKDKVSWFNRIRYWKYLKRDYEKQVMENTRKSEMIHNIKIQLDISQQMVGQLESDIKNKKRS
jgi:hypothetical protein